MGKNKDGKKRSRTTRSSSPEGTEVDNSDTIDTKNDPADEIGNASKKEEINDSDIEETINIPTNTESSDEDSNIPPPSKKVKRLTLTNLTDFNAKLAKRGVLYISRIQPRMNPHKIKTLLSEFGEITRVYLAEEDKSARARRKKQGGHGGKRYTEGWVEFASKRICSRVGVELNNTPISNYKRSAHFGDLWNVKYLKGFRWSHLTEKVAYERRVREHKLKLEMMQAKKESAAYKNLVEMGKTLDRIEERRGKRGEGGASTVGNWKKRDIYQTKPVGDGIKAAKKVVLSSLL